MRAPFLLATTSGIQWNMILLFSLSLYQCNQRPHFLDFERMESWLNFYALGGKQDFTIYYYINNWAMSTKPKNELCLTLIKSFDSKFSLQYAIANTMMVAVAVSCFPPPQHSPIFGHLASSHTYSKEKKVNIRERESLVKQ